ncbi:MAG: NADH-quinone oxidoreductase subunit G [Sulfurimonas sp.]|jgi:NADH-quinone oxidoreductase subunit G
MATITVDGKELKVKDDVMLIEELLANSISIPHFCYHPALGKDGNCRMCMVEIKGQKRPQIACDTPIKDGMVISTKSDSIQEVKRSILELELINHPVDCSVCDQSGECSLQNYYMDVGLYESRLSTTKVHARKKVDLGANVVLDQERCVLCTRCVRFTKEITKTRELGILNRTDHSVIATFEDQPLTDPYAMNVVDLCPVGALTSKDFRFNKRVWFLEPEESICNRCAKACSIYVDHHKAKYEADAIFRYRPRFNPKVNGYFICDVGRLSYKVENENRLSVPFINNEQNNYKETSKELKSLLLKHKSKTLFLISPSLSLEEMLMVKKLEKFYNAKVSAFDINEYDKDFGDDYLKCNDLSTNRRGLNLLDIDENENILKEVLSGSELVVFIGRDDIEILDNYKNIQSQICISSSTPKNQQSYNIYLPVLTHTSKEGSYINIDGYLQFSKAKVLSQNDTKNLIEVASELLDEKVLSCEQIYKDELSQIVDNITFNEIKIQSRKLSSI